MKEQMKRQYEAPLISITRVVIEGTLCASITNDEGKKSEVKATQQEYTEYDMTGINNWD